jgi:hypothetical protein
MLIENKEVNTLIDIADDVSEHPGFEIDLAENEIAQQALFSRAEQNHAALKLHYSNAKEYSILQNDANLNLTSYIDLKTNSWFTETSPGKFSELNLQDANGKNKILELLENGARDSSNDFLNGDSVEAEKDYENKISTASVIQFISKIENGRAYIDFSVFKKISVDEKFQFKTLDEVVEVKGQKGSGWEIGQVSNMNPVTGKPLKLKKNGEEGKGKDGEKEHIWELLRQQGWAEEIEDGIQTIYFATGADISFVTIKRTESVAYQELDDLLDYDDDDLLTAKKPVLTNVVSSVSVKKQEQSTKTNAWKLFSDALLNTNSENSNPSAKTESIFNIFGNSKNESVSQPLTHTKTEPTANLPLTGSIFSLRSPEATSSLKDSKETRDFKYEAVSLTVRKESQAPSTDTKDIGISIKLNITSSSYPALETNGELQDSGIEVNTDFESEDDDLNISEKTSSIVKKPSIAQNKDALTITTKKSPIQKLENPYRQIIQLSETNNTNNLESANPVIALDEQFTNTESRIEQNQTIQEPKSSLITKVQTTSEITKDVSISQRIPEKPIISLKADNKEAPVEENQQILKTKEIESTFGMSLDKKTSPSTLYIEKSNQTETTGPIVITKAKDSYKPNPAEQNFDKSKTEAKEAVVADKKTDVITQGKDREIRNVKEAISVGEVAVQEKTTEKLDELPAQQKTYERAGKVKAEKETTKAVARSPIKANPVILKKEASPRIITTIKSESTVFREISESKLIPKNIKAEKNTIKVISKAKPIVVKTPINVRATSIKKESSPRPIATIKRESTALRQIKFNREITENNLAPQVNKEVQEKKYQSLPVETILRPATIINRQRSTKTTQITPYKNQLISNEKRTTLASIFSIARQQKNTTPVSTFKKNALLRKNQIFRGQGTINRQSRPTLQSSQNNDNELELISQGTGIRLAA